MNVKKQRSVILSVLMILLFLPSSLDAEIYREFKNKGGFNYQAVVRDAEGNPLINANITVQFSILSSAGEAWVESHSTFSNAYGMVNVVIGEGERMGGSNSVFEEIDWSESLALNVQVDAGQGLVNLGTIEFQSVPYAMYATNGLTSEQSSILSEVDIKAEENVQSDWNETESSEDGYIMNKPIIPADINQLSDADGLLTGSTFDGKFTSLTEVPVNLDTDATDDFNGDYNALTNKPTIPVDINELSDADAKLFSGSYNDLRGQPTIPVDLNQLTDTDSKLFSGSFSDLEGLPVNLDTDATDDFNGDYTALTNKPTIPVDINELSDADAKLFSGSYNDLRDQPTIPVDLNQLTDTDSKLFSGSFSDLEGLPVNLDTDATDDFSGDYNALTNKPTIPADINELADADAKLFSGSYNDLRDQPTIPVDLNQLTDTDSKLFSGSFSDLEGLPVNLDTDATDDFSGDYNALTNKPTIPVDINELTDADAKLFSGSYNDLRDQPTIPVDLNQLTDSDSKLFSGSFSDLEGLPVNLDTDVTDDFSGDYNDLNNKPAIPADLNQLNDIDGKLFSGSFSDLEGLPVNLDTDATDDFSGDYNALTNRPTIPADINELTDADAKLFSGSYNDLRDQPTIPVDLNQLTDTDSKLFSGSFSDLEGLPANLDTDVTDDFSGDYNDLANVPTIPADVNELNDVEGKLFSGSYSDLTDIPANIDTDATDDFSGDYNALTNKPSIPSDVNELADADGKLFSGSYADLSNVPANIDTDATDDFSGNYADLANKPTIPSDVNELADADGKLFSGSYADLSNVPANIDTDATDDFSGDYNDLTNKPSLPFVEQSSEVLFSSGIVTPSLQIFDGSNGKHYYLPSGNGEAGQVLTADEFGSSYWTTPTSFSGNYNALTNKPTIPSDINELSDADTKLFSGSFEDLFDLPTGLSDGDDVDDADSDPGNELQHLELNGTLLTLTMSDAPTIDLGEVLPQPEDQSLRFDLGIISLTNDPDDTEIDLSGYDDDASDDFSGDYDHLINKPTIISSLSSHSVTELNDVSNAGSGQIITTEERNLIDNWNGSDAKNITATDIDNWNDAFGWGDHADIDFVIEGDFADLDAAQALTTANITGWNTTKDYFDPTDAPTAGSIGDTEITAWNQSVAWGDHSTAGYASEADFGDLATVQGIEAADVASWDAAGASIAANAANWDEAHTWGDHSEAGYLKVVTGANITDATIGNEDISGSAAISSSKLETTVLVAGEGNAQLLNDAGYLLAADQVVTKTGNLIQTGDTDDDFLYGSTQLDNIDGIGTDDGRIFFDKSKGAFRAGVASGNQWDETNIGDFSVVVGGAGNIASGLQSAVVGGLFNTATAERSISAGGYLNNATGDYSNVYGGLLNNATSSRSSVLGGESNTASGGYATVSGGYQNTASGAYSHVSGLSNTASAYGETVFGHYATIEAGQNAGGVTVTDRLFTIGNGLAADNRSNALVVHKDGSTDINGTLTVSAAVDNNSAAGNRPDLDSHVMVIENTSTQNNDAGFTNPSGWTVDTVVPDVNSNNNNGLAINLNVPLFNVNSDNNFITFYRKDDVISGRIEGQHTADFIKLYQAIEGAIVSVAGAGLEFADLLEFDIQFEENISNWLEIDEGNLQNAWNGGVPFYMNFSNAKVNAPELYLPWIQPTTEKVLGVDVVTGMELKGGGVAEPSVDWPTLHGTMPSLTFDENTLPSLSFLKSPITIGNEFIKVKDAQLDNMINAFTVELPTAIGGFGGAIIDGYDNIRDPLKSKIKTAITIARDVSSGGVTYNSGSGDYAEWLEMEDVNEEFGPGIVVGVHAGKISRRTEDADHVMVISMDPIVLGNSPEEGRAHEFQKVAFMGQVPVRTFGEVDKGDILIASGRNDGEAIGISPDEITPAQLAKVVGVAWSDSYNDWGVSYVKASVGLKNVDISNLMMRMNDRLTALEAKNKELLLSNKALTHQQKAYDERFSNLEANLEALLTERSGSSNTYVAAGNEE